MVACPEHFAKQAAAHTVEIPEQLQQLPWSWAASLGAVETAHLQCWQGHRKLELGDVGVMHQALPDKTVG